MASTTTEDRLLNDGRRYAVDFASRRRTRHALDELTQAGDDRVLGRAVRLAESANPDDRALAALLCSRLLDGAPGAGRTLIFSLAHDRDPVVLAAAAEALKPVAGAPAMAILRRLAGHTDPAVRRGVAIALYGRTSPSAIAALSELSRDADGDVREWAVWALADTPSRSQKRSTALRGWLKRHGGTDQLTERVRTALEE